MNVYSVNMSAKPSTKDRILSCAREIYLRDGYAYLSMRKVAACAGISATAIYRHFQDKEALLIQLMAEGFARFQQHLDDARQGGEPMADLRAAAEAYADFALTHPADYTILFSAPDELMELKRQDPERAQQRRASFWLLVELVEAVIATQAAHTDGPVPDPETAALRLWGHMHGMVSLYLGNKFEMSEDAFRAFYGAAVESYMRRMI